MPRDPPNVVVSRRVIGPDGVAGGDTVIWSVRNASGVEGAVVEWMFAMAVGG